MQRGFGSAPHAESGNIYIFLNSIHTINCSITKMWLKSNELVSQHAKSMEKKHRGTYEISFAFELAILTNYIFKKISKSISIPLSLIFN